VTDRSLRTTFETAAERYDRARPAYPEQLFDDLVGLAGLAPPDRLLEVGCGTGKATRPLLERGFRVDCVELGPRLAAQARQNLAGLPCELHVAPFETWDHDPGSFALVYAATAWHWLDPELRFRRAHTLLRPGGHLAFWTARHAFPAGFDPFFTEIQQVYDELGESHEGEWPPPAPDEVPDDAAEIGGSGLFDRVRTRRYLWEARYTADRYVELLDTFSGHLAMEPEKREHLYSEVLRRLARRADGSVLRHWSAILHVARRVEVAASVAGCSS
jgi:SAM-dependent methyltransferase